VAIGAVKLQPVASGCWTVTAEVASSSLVVPVFLMNLHRFSVSLPKWNNQILIDGTNPFHGSAGKFTLADVGNLSTGQFIAALAPGSRVVKALNTIIVPNLEADPVVGKARRVLFISGDDDGAKIEVETLLTGFGYSVIDLGNLRDGGLIQQAGGPLAGRNLFEEGERHK
jgi:predicted dinucleotide-binding enzyme